MPSLNRWHAAWIAVAAAVCLIASIAAWHRHELPPGPLRVTSGSTPAPVIRAGVSPVPDGPVYVHVTGQVLKPGLYRMVAGARVMDAITMAGGASPQADLDALNLATPLHDGQKLTVPALGQASPPPQQDYVVDSPAPVPPAQTASPTTLPSEQTSGVIDPQPTTAPTLTADDIPAPRNSSHSGKFRNPGDGMVDINTGGASELEKLPGVGPATAKKIIEYRAEHEGFKTVEELMEVKGIGPAKLRKMKPFVTVNARGE